MKAIGVFGGAFAPFHNGHMRLAIEARERLQLARVHLIPTAQPVHRPDSHVTPLRRLDWLQRAVRYERELVADDREILRDGPSFSVQTLQELRDDYPDAALVLLMGADAFAHLHAWHQWERLLTLGHIVVFSRPGSVLAPSAETCERLSSCQARQVAELHAQPAGCWFQFELPLLDISSTRIRRLLRTGRSIRGLVPDAILNAMTAADVAALTQDDDATTH